MPRASSGVGLASGNALAAGTSEVEHSVEAAATPLEPQEPTMGGEPSMGGDENARPVSDDANDAYDSGDMPNDVIDMGVTATLWLVAAPLP